MSGGGGLAFPFPISSLPSILPLKEGAQVNGQLNDINFMVIQTSPCVSLVRFVY